MELLVIILFPIIIIIVIMHLRSCRDKHTKIEGIPRKPWLPETKAFWLGVAKLAIMACMVLICVINMQININHTFQDTHVKGNLTNPLKVSIEPIEHKMTGRYSDKVEVDIRHKAMSYL